jgi:putative FmdB family regulatory protein
MPTYDFECSVCKIEFEYILPIEQRNNLPSCPKCSTAEHVLRIYVKGPQMIAFPGSDALRSRVDAHANLVREVQAEGIRSNTEVEVGMEAAHDRAKKLGIPVEKILGPKGKKPALTEEKKAEFKKLAAAQHSEVTK